MDDEGIPATYNYKRQLRRSSRYLSSFAKPRHRLYAPMIHFNAGVRHQFSAQHLAAKYPARLNNRSLSACPKSSAPLTHIP